MIRGLNAEIRRVVLISLVFGLLGFINGHIAWSLVAGGVLYLAWIFQQIHRLEQWLRSGQAGPPPEASGIWGDIFDNIYRLQRKHKKEKQQLQILVNRVQEATAVLRDGVILLDARGNMNWWNRSAQRLIGFQSTDQGQALLNFIRNPRFVAYFEAGKYAEPLEMSSPRGRGQRLQFQVNRYGNNERLVVVRNVTRLYRLEQMRQDFIANVSHEMRTPLTVVQGYIETFADSEQLPGPWQSAFDQMQHQTQRMSLLINDLITLSRLETEDADDQQSDVLLKPLLTTIQNEAIAFSGPKKHLITVEGDEQTLINGNDKELHSAISNLAFNAVKYSPEGSQIKLAFHQDDKGLVISVEDNGPGIEAKHIPRLTERFYRVDASRNSESGGTGLGLAIVKHVLLRHDGRLSITSQINKGSKFSCLFPHSRVIKQTTN